MSIPTQIAETIQTAHIKRDPSPHHDINPSTTASALEPVRLDAAKPSSREYDDDDDDKSLDDEEDDEISVSILRPRKRRNNLNLPPMPDLRFEQSYLHSIEDAQGWMIAWITVRDQIMMPLAQGILWNLATIGWQHWNRNAQYSGKTIGARARRWWYGVNNWPIPGKKVKAS